MKTPMQELIEQLEKFLEEDDVPNWFHKNGIKQAIKYAESLLGKEKEFMQKVYANAKATGEMDEAVRTFNN